MLSAAATGPAIGTLIASYAGCNREIVIISFTGGMALMGAFVPSLKVNPLDLSPNYAGSLMAVVGCVGAISGIFAPQLVGFMTTHVSMPSTISKKRMLIGDSARIFLCQLNISPKVE